MLDICTAFAAMLLKPLRESNLAAGVICLLTSTGFRQELISAGAAYLRTQPRDLWHLKVPVARVRAAVQGPRVQVCTNVSQKHRIEVLFAYVFA